MRAGTGFDEEDLNTGAYAATGKYLMFVDADDWLDDNCLEILSENAKKTDADRVIGSYRHIDDDGVVLKNNIIKGDDTTIWYHTMQQGNLFKRSIYIENGVKVSDNIAPDGEKVLKFTVYGRNVVYVSDVIYNYYVHQSTSNSKKTYERILEKTKRYSFSSISHIVKTEVCPLLHGDELERCEYEIVRLYYAYILQHVRYAPYKKALEVYKIIRNDMIADFPDYLRNKNATYRKSIGNSRLRRALVPICVIAEKTHTFKLFLLLFTTVAKIKYLPT